MNYPSSAPGPSRQNCQRQADPGYWRWLSSSGRRPRSVAACCIAGPLGGLIRPRGQQERDNRGCETGWILPAEKMAKFRQDHELGVWDAVREQSGVARVDHGVLSSLEDERAGADVRLPQTAG